MELRYVDPRILKENPDNPRNIKPDRGLRGSARCEYHEAVGLDPTADRARDQRRYCHPLGRPPSARLASRPSLDRIPVLVNDDDAKIDRMRAYAENLLRQGYATVDIYRAMQNFSADGWTDDGIATALNLPPRTVKRLKLCGGILPAILDHMATGDEPQTNHPEVDRPGKPRAKTRRRLGRNISQRKASALHGGISRAFWTSAVCGRATRNSTIIWAKAYGIVWVEDLFEQGDQDNRYTTHRSMPSSAHTARMDVAQPPGAGADRPPDR